MLDKVKLFMKKLWDNPKFYWLFIALVFVICRLGTWLYPFDSDHWIFYYLGNDWFHGGSLYVTAWDHKPPVIFLLNGLMSLFGNSLLTHRIIITIFAVVDIYLFYKLAKIFAQKLLPKRAELFTKLSLLLYVFWRNLMQFTSSGNNNENFGLIFYLGMLLSYFSFLEDRKWWKMLISGSCFAILFFMKGNFLLLAAPLGVILFIDFYKKISKFFIHGITFIFPLIILAAGLSLYFFSKGSLNDFVIASFSFSAKYSSSAWSGGLSDLKVFYLLVAFASPLIVFVPIFFAYIYRKHIVNIDFLFIFLSLAFGSVAFFAVGVPYLYYFLILMPVYILAATYLFLTKEDINKYIGFIFIIIFCFGMGINFLYSNYQIIKNQISNVATEAEEYRSIAQYIDGHSNPSDKVFVNDYGATFYRLSNRKSGSRFVSASVLLLDYRGNYGFDLDKIFISDMDKSQAKYVVTYKDKSTLYYQNKPVIRYFDSHYHLEKSFKKFEVLRRN